jgi:CHAD domain-containing protein
LPYAIRKKDAHVPAAIRRVAGDQFTAAVSVLSQSELPMEDRVHQARKAVKHLRGLIRLVRPVFPAYAATNEALRDAGREMAALRDAQVALWTFDALAKGLAPEKTAPLRALFETRLQTALAPELLSQQLDAFAARMQLLQTSVPDWQIKRQGFDALEQGLTRCLKAARADELAARTNPGAETVHDWRKRVKDHWHQARFLAPIWPEMMQPQVVAAAALGDMLGEYQDISVLRDRLPNGRAAAAIIKAGKARQNALLAKAHPLSRRLFADAPDALADRWRVWWQVWRST